ncbi:MAG TPA: hypothetical protein VK251_10435 [Steroidobacteraceae bacterium]|nr:hypothetical protein [Steroidobacteraceae bacterium]
MNEILDLIRARHTAASPLRVRREVTEFVYRKRYGVPLPADP